MAVFVPVQISLWDDADIFSLFGSFPPSMQRCTVFNGLFEVSQCVALTRPCGGLQCPATCQVASLHLASLVDISTALEAAADYRTFLQVARRFYLLIQHHTTAVDAGRRRTFLSTT